MLEIFLLIHLCKSNRRNALQRGRSGALFIFLTIAAWLVILYGSIIFTALNEDYPWAILVGILAVIAAQIGINQWSKNCSYGPNRPFGTQPLPNAEVSPYPTQINIVRDDTAGKVYKLMLNGDLAGTVRGRNYATLTTNLVHNVIFVRDFYDTPQPFCFTVNPGTVAEIHVMHGRFIPESCINCCPIDAYAVSQAMQQQMQMNRQNNML